MKEIVEKPKLEIDKRRSRWETRQENTKSEAEEGPSIVTKSIILRQKDIAISSEHFKVREKRTKRRTCSSELFL